MKALCLSVLQLSFAVNCFSQPDIKKIEKSFIALNDTLIVSSYEVSNALYRDFISYTILFNKSELTFVQIDSANWREKNFYNEPFAQYYHLHPAYDNYPVVNVSYEGMVRFCKWLTKCYNNYPDRKYKKVIFNLPSEEEWEFAAKKLENSDNAEFPNQIMPIDSYRCKGGIFNFNTNVSEMTNSKGVVKGRNWNSNKDNQSVTDNYPFEERSAPNVGFRFFAGVIER